MQQGYTTELGYHQQFVGTSEQAAFTDNFTDSFTDNFTDTLVVGGQKGGQKGSKGAHPQINK